MSETESAARRLREKFENREAIYVEKGALRVRVTNIRAGGSRFVSADIEEIPTKGFELLRLHYRRVSDPRLLFRWSIGAGYLTGFSEQTWEMGYGGWSLFFDPGIVRGVVEMASQWSDGHGVDPTAAIAVMAERYEAVCRFLDDHDAYKERSVRLFPEEVGPASEFTGGS